MAKANKINQIETKDINKIIGIEGSNIEKLGNTPVSFVQIPAGLIIPLNSASIPDGWEAFNSANNRLIIGAGNTYSVGQTGGLVNGGSLGTFGGTSGSAGAHLPGANLLMLPILGGSGWYSRGNYSSGAHTHALGNTVLNQLDKNQFPLIKATIDHNVVPINGVMISETSLVSQGMSIIAATNKYLSAGSSVAQYNKLCSVALGSAGTHAHQDWYGASGGGSQSTYISNIVTAGNHTASKSINTYNLNLKRLLLSLWSNASQTIDLTTNMIAMWESLTPPDGWLTCDGNNGTPDLRDNFIQNVSSGSENITSQGTNQITLGINTSMNHSNSHNHAPTRGWTSNITIILKDHSTYANSHTHTFNVSKLFSLLPAYYALSFIIKE